MLFPVDGVTSPYARSVARALQEVFLGNFWPSFAEAAKGRSWATCADGIQLAFVSKTSDTKLQTK